MTARFHIKENGILDRSRNDKRLNPVELCNTLNALDCIADKNVDEYEYIKRLECENEQLKQRIKSRLHFYRELYETTNDDVVKRVIEDLEDVLR